MSLESKSGWRDQLLTCEMTDAVSKELYLNAEDGNRIHDAMCCYSELNMPHSAERTWCGCLDHSDSSQDEAEEIFHNNS